MGQQQSKDELLYQQVSYGNAQGIKTLRSQGAGLEWIDREGKTPLILACMNPELYNVAKTLIELGANINFYRPGRQAGTPLHHAAKRGLENTVKLLLSRGANPLMMNDDCLTPLEVARAKGFSNVVRAIENHICLFSGWLREFYGPGFLEALAPQFLSRKVWVVVLPTGSPNLKKPFKLELAIYSGLQDSKPRTLIALWKANLEEPKFNQPDPSVIIVDNSAKPRIKLAAGNENDRQQLQWFCDACKGIPQAMHPVFLHDSQRPAVQANAPPDTEDLELAMAINASIQSAIEETHVFHVQSMGEASTSASRNESMNGYSHGGTGNSRSAPPKACGEQRAAEANPSSGGNSIEAKLNSNTSMPTIIETSDAIPSAPPITHEIIEDGPVHYPSIDSSPVVMSSPDDDNLPAANTSAKKDDGGSSICAICLDAPSEAACVPCGHVAGCMSCLNEIKSKKWGCPVCRAKIEQVIKIYRV